MSVIASHLVFADPANAAAGDADPDVVVSQGADLLHPTSRDVLAEHIGDLRISSPEVISELPLPPLPLLQSSGPVPTRAEQIIDTATTAWSVILRSTREHAVSAQYAARAAAALLVRHGDGIAIDVAIPRIWPSLGPEADPERTADWFVLDRSPGEGATISTTTRGLSRFGVSELRVADVPPDAAVGWDAVLTGLAHRLVTSPDLSGSVEIGLTDIAAGYAEPIDPDDPGVQRRTTLDLTTDGDVLAVSGTAVADLFSG